MSDKWYSRPVLFVVDIDRSVDFYVKQLGFTQPWRYEDDGRPLSRKSTGRVASSFSLRNGPTRWARA